MNKILFLTFILFFGSCEEKNKPEFTLNEEQLFQVFKDVKIAENALLKQGKSVRDSLRTVYRKQISQIHKIPFETIEVNLIELQKDILMQKLFYEQLRDTLGEYDKIYK